MEPEFDNDPIENKLYQVDLWWLRARMPRPGAVVRTLPADYNRDAFYFHALNDSDARTMVFGMLEFIKRDGPVSSDGARGRVRAVALSEVKEINGKPVMAIESGGFRREIAIEQPIPNVT